MKKTDYTTVKLEKGEMNVYDFGTVSLHVYKTNDFMDDEVFILVKNGKGVCIELPCFHDNIAELAEYIERNNIELVAKFVAYHAAGATFMPNVGSYATESSNVYNTVGGGAGLVNNFTNAFGKIFDNGLVKADNIISDGEIVLGGIRFIIKSNSDAYDIEIPEINCVYTHMMGHDCHSIVAGKEHADSIISQLEHYMQKGFDLILTSHYTPEDLKDVQTKIAYLKTLESLSSDCKTAEEMKEKMLAKFPDYSGLNYLDMTVGMLFPKK